MKITVTTKKGVFIIPYNPSTNILDAISSHIPNIVAPCGGKGKCGKCIIKVESGDVPFNENYSKFLTQDEIKQGYRLACKSYAFSDAVITLGENEENDFNIIGTKVEKEIKINPIVEKHKVDFSEVNWEKEYSLVKIIYGQLGKEYTLSLNAMRKLSRVINSHNELGGKQDYYGINIIWVIICGQAILDIQFEKDISIYGIAIDIGTTTFAMNLYNIETGNYVGDYKSTNPQRMVGADVISRIEYAIEHGTDLLQKKIVDVIKNGVRILAKHYEITPEHIYKIVITGNTTMLHFLSGTSAESLSQVPFTSTFLEELCFTYNELFEDKFLPHAIVTMLPGISAYVGSDILAGMLSVDMDLSDNPLVLIDIGTNGEIAIGNKNNIYCTATAAGPAFEGGNISCGMGSIEGAISKIKQVDNEFIVETIGGASPIGVCGTGVIDLVAEGLINDWIDSTGALTSYYKNKDVFITKDSNGKGITFTQKDIREIQLAKAAIRAGLEIIIQQYGCTYDEIDTVYLAGGFGTYVDLNNIIKIGIIPTELKDRIKAVGNTSLSGGVEYLLCKNSRKRLKNMKKIVHVIDLGGSREFNELFVDSIYF